MVIYILIAVIIKILINNFATYSWIVGASPRYHL